jgi:hypothetical protein
MFFDEIEMIADKTCCSERKTDYSIKKGKITRY